LFQSESTAWITGPVTRIVQWAEAPVATLHAGLVGRVEEPGGLFIEVELAAAAAEEIAQVMPITGREISVAGSVLALVIGYYRGVCPSRSRAARAAHPLHRDRG